MWSCKVQLRGEFNLRDRQQSRVTCFPAYSPWVRPEADLHVPECAGGLLHYAGFVAGCIEDQVNKC